MEIEAKESVAEEENVSLTSEPSQELQDTQAESYEAPNDAAQAPLPNNKSERSSYGKKFSARVYKYFTLATFLIYYINCMVRIAINCSKYFKSQGIKTFSQWFMFMLDTDNWPKINKEIFDWYTITLLVFLLLYAIVFAVTFMRFSPKHKKTFKVFKKGFLMARRVIKLISVGLTLTVLINSAQLASFGDKFMFVISLCSILFTLVQIGVSIASWVIGKKLNKSVKQYVGNVVTNYLSSPSRSRPQIELEGGKHSVGNKLSVVKDRFLRTIETLTLTKEEAMQRDAEMSMYVIENTEITDRFENDYKEKDKVEKTLKEKKKPRKSKHSISKGKKITKSEKNRQAKAERAKASRVTKTLKTKSSSKKVVKEAACDVVNESDKVVK